MARLPAAGGRLAMLCGAALLLSGCTQAVVGAPAPNPAAAQQALEERTPLTSALAFGDLTTIDYCSLIDPGLVAQGGLTDAGELRPSFDECAVSGKIDGQSATLEVGFLDSKAGGRLPDREKTLPRGLVAQRDTSGRGSDSCGYYLAFPDRVSLELYAYLENPVSDPGWSATSSPLCALDKTVFDGVVKAVTQKKVTHFTFAPGSVGTVDACALLPDPVVVQQSGSPLQREPNPSKHRCRWTSTGLGARAVLWFYVDKPPQAAGGATAETIADRPSVVRSVDARFCVVDTVVGPWPGAKNGEVEVAETYMIVGSVAKEPCGVARAFAAAAWPRLPSS
jgi:hypothetical protein